MDGEAEGDALPCLSHSRTHLSASPQRMGWELGGRGRGEVEDEFESELVVIDLVDAFVVDVRR